MNEIPIGWLSPGGEIIKCDPMLHYWWAEKLMEKYNYSWNGEMHADEALTNNGWVHITISAWTHEYMVFWKVGGHLTQLQKDFLKPYFENPDIKFGFSSRLEWEYEMGE